MAVSVTYRWIHRVWYEGAASGLLLLPLSGLYWLILRLRKLLYRYGILSASKAEVPVIVVGNITAGGTGKTPTVIWLVSELRSKGYTPGIVSRGYGGSKSGSSMRVDIYSDAAVVGDEPVLLARRGCCPVVVDANRVRAASMLVDDGVDVIVADDGLQHLQLERDFEICVIDGSRGLGNLRLLPSGPLREMPQRLKSVDQILINGEGDFPDSISFELLASDANRLNGSLARPLQEFSGTTVHAVAGIGNPSRFFDLLRLHNIQIIEHSFPDHTVLTEADLNFSDPFEVFMTEKDAVKLGRNLPDKFWFVPVELSMDPAMSSALIEKIELCLQGCGEMR
jgi:tetraacyldisaccharide 4'-kinase